MFWHDSITRPAFLFVVMGLMGCLEIENIEVKTADFLNNLVSDWWLLICRGE
jgi:hypothetical protein